MTQTQKKPLISVIMPVYNGEDYLYDALKSVAEQTYSNFEAIIIDDCSTDKSSEIIRAYTHDSRFRPIFRQQNGGVATAQNDGVLAAKGDWVALIGCDDLWLPEKLEKQVALIEMDPSISLVFSNGIEFNESGDYGLFYKERKKFPEGDILSRLLVRNCLWASSVMVKRQDLLRVGMFDAGLCVGEDYFVWIKVLSDGGNAMGVWEPIVKYRKRAGSLTANKVRAYADLETIHRSLLNCNLTKLQCAILKHSIKRDCRDQILAKARQNEQGRMKYASELCRAWLCYTKDIKPLLWLLVLCLPDGVERLKKWLARKW